MKEYYKRKFSLTDEGAKKVTKSTILSLIHI